MKNKVTAIILVALLIAVFLWQDPWKNTKAQEVSADMTGMEASEEKAGITLDKRILVIETNINAIMEKASPEFFGNHPVTDSFFFWIVQNYGDDVLKKIVENRDYADPKVWFRITGKSIHVLYDEYASYVGLDAWDYSHVHHIDSENDTVEFVFSGDVTIHEGAATTLHMEECENGITDCFSTDLMEVMQGADVFAVNNEFCYSKRGEPTAGKDYTFRADPKRVEDLKKLGCDLACLANNHVFDYGEEALSDTLKTLKDAKLPYIGAGENLREAERIQYYIWQGLKIAIVNATQIERSTTFTREATATQSGVFKTLNPDNCIKAITKAKKNADLCLVAVHWGTEGNAMYGSDQTALATAYVGAGADAIIGGHTHCLQGIEYMNDVPIFYSLGNFWFSTSGNMPADYDTGLAVIRITSEGKIKPAFVPAHFSGAEVSLCTNEEAERIYSHIESISQSTLIDSKGRIKRR